MIMRHFSAARAVCLAATTVLVALAQYAAADLPFSVSYPQQCTPLNVTFTPQADAFPYTVYILNVGAQVQSYTINSDYQDADVFTFQWQVPTITSIFNSFVIAIADNSGNGNSTGVLAVDVENGSDDCQPYSASTSFNFAGDSTSGNIADRVQCTDVRYYPVLPPFRGTAPFSISYVPLNGVPITVSIPQSAYRNGSYFIYETPIPLEAGTQYYGFLSDAAGGGSGGGSPIYTVAPSDDRSCLNGAIDNQAERALPRGQTTAVFRNLEGAIDAPPESGNGTMPSTGGGSEGGSDSNVGGIVGGVIGAVIGVALILLCVLAFFLFRRRQRRKAELERKEQPQFVDLDDDEEAGAGASSRGGTFGRSNGRPQRSRVESLAVSPFTYESTDAPQGGGTQGEMRNAPPRSGSYGNAAALGLGAAGAAGAAGAYGAGHTSPRNEDSSSPLIGSNGYNNSNQGYDPQRTSLSNAHGTDSEYVSVYGGHGNGGQNGHANAADMYASPGSGHGAPGSPRRGSNGYILRARNEDAPSSNQAGPLPTKGSERAANDADGGRAAARLMQHTDGGPVSGYQRGGNSIEELPPSYGQLRGGSQRRPA